MIFEILFVAFSIPSKNSIRGEHLKAQKPRNSQNIIIQKLRRLNIKFDRLNSLSNLQKLTANDYMFLYSMPSGMSRYSLRQCRNSGHVFSTTIRYQFCEKKLKLYAFRQ